MQLNAVADYEAAYKVCDHFLIVRIKVLILGKEIHHLSQNAYASSPGAHFGY